MTTVFKDKILRSDFANWDGLSSTRSRKDSTGGTVTGLKVGTEVDVLQVYGGGIDYNDATIQKCVDAIGSNAVTLVFQPGTWTISADVTVASTCACRVPNGVVFSVASGKTLTFSGPVIRDGQTWTGGSGTVTENGTRYISGKVDLAAAVLQGASPLVFEGGTDNAFKTTFTFTDPTGNRTITFPDGNVDFTNVVVSSGSYTFTGANTFSGNTTHSGTLTMSGASIIEAEGAAVVSAGTIDIWANDGNTIHVTGSTGPITSVGTAPQAGTWKKVIFDSTPTMTHSSSLNLPDGEDYTVYAGQPVLFYADTTTQIDVIPLYPRTLGNTADQGVGTLNAHAFYDDGVLLRPGDILSRDVSENEVAGSDTETTVYTNTVNGGTLSTNRMIRITILGYTVDNNAGNSTLTVNLKYGGSTLCAVQMTHGSTSASPKPLRITGEISAANSASIQHAILHAVMGPGVALGGTGGSVEDEAISHQEAAVDSAQSQTLAVSFQMSINNANVQFNCRVVHVEIL